MAGRFIPTVERESIDFMCVYAVDIYIYIGYLSLSFRDRNVAGKLPSRYNECRLTSLHSLEQGALVHWGVPC